MMEIKRRRKNQKSKAAVYKSDKAQRETSDAFLQTCCSNKLHHRSSDCARLAKHFVTNFRSPRHVKLLKFKRNFSADISSGVRALSEVTKFRCDWLRPLRNCNSVKMYINVGASCAVGPMCCLFEIRKC